MNHEERSDTRWSSGALGLDTLLIDGELVEAAGGATFDNVNPATEEVVGVAADGGAADMDAALAAARQAFDGTDWSRDHDFRGHCLEQLRDALVTHHDEVAALTTAEGGAPAALLAGPALVDPVQGLSFAAEMARGYDRWVEDLGTAAPVGVPSHRWVLREAAGVVGAITPWNFPHQINLAKVGPALAAGCTVVLKPAPDTPWAAAVRIPSWRTRPASHSATARLAWSSAAPRSPVQAWIVALAASVLARVFCATSSRSSSASASK